MRFLDGDNGIWRRVRDAYAKHVPARVTFGALIVVFLGAVVIGEVARIVAMG